MKKFRIYPESRSLYYLVKVFPDRKSWLKYLIKENKNKYSLFKNDETQALCRPQIVESFKNGKRKLRPLCGELLLHEERLDTEIAAHEIAHATLDWARRININVNKEGNNGFVSFDEERFCYAHGEMVKQLTNKLYQLKVWK